MTKIYLNLSLLTLTSAKIPFYQMFLQGDQNHDNWIFALATLLSSTLVYNALGAINEDALAKLKYPFREVCSK